MKKISTKNKYLLVIGIMLFAFIVIGVSYSFYKPRLTKINDTETVIKTNELGLVYTGPNNVSCTNMVPGDKCIKHFTIENTSEVAVIYNIYMEQITNEFNEDLVYTLTDNNGNVVEETYLPKTNDGKEYIKMNKTQEAKTTKNYTLTVEYKYSQIVDQSKYMGAEFKATIGMDTKQFTEVANCANYSCENEDGTINNGESSINGNIAKIIGTIAIVDLSNPVSEEIKEIEDNNTTTYGNEKAISHDIYYSEEAKYSNGLNERYTTYCTPYENNKESGVIYCTRKNRKGTCKKTTKTKTCTYEKAKNDLGLTTFEYQSKRENFADEGNGNWHIQTYCEEAKQETLYEGGYYYCDKHEDLHDWYDIEEFSSSELICKRATELHTETCNQKNSEYCKGAGYTLGSTITYGNLGTSGTLTSGDAFDCDVDGTGYNHRFYFVSYKYIDGKTGYETYDTNIATLIYYNNVSEGIANNKATYSYHYGNCNYQGPIIAVQQLPTTTQWSKLKSTKRAILNEVGENYNTYSSTNYELPGNGKDPFDYSSYAARFLTYQEVKKTCEHNPWSSGTISLDNCQYLMENTHFSDSNLTYGYWLETPQSVDSGEVYYIIGYRRRTSNARAGYSSDIGVRPTIDVPIANIEV